MVQYSCTTKQNDNERIDIRGFGSTSSTSSPPVSPASRMKTTVGSSSPKKSTKSTTGSTTTTRRTRPSTTKNNNNNNNVTFSPLGRNNMPVKSKSTPSGGGGNVDPKNQQPDFRKVKPYSLKEKTRSVSMPSSKKKKATTVNGSYSNAHSPIKESADRHSRMSSTGNTGRSSSRSNTPTKHRPYNAGTSCYSNTHDRNHRQTSTDRPFHHSPKAHKPRAGVRQQQQRKSQNE